jgi:hypothetical protein
MSDALAIPDETPNATRQPSQYPSPTPNHLAATNPGPATVLLRRVATRPARPRLASVGAPFEDDPR